MGEGKPGMGWATGASLAVFTVLSLLSAIQEHVWSRGTPTPSPWVGSLFSGFLWMGPWGLVAPLVLRLGERRPFSRAQAPAFLAWHLAGMVGALAPLWLIQQAIRLFRAGVLHGWDRRLLGVPRITWADLLVDLMGVPLVYGGVLLAGEALRHARARREEAFRGDRLAGQLAEARLALLQRQVHPHFLFNALQAVSTLLHRDPALADRTLVRLSGLLRRTLDDGPGGETTLGAELDLARAYLDIEQVRFQERLGVSVEVPEDLLACQVPSLILLPLVENAIRHGLSGKPGPGRIALRAWADGPSLRVSVEDDGPGASLPLREGIGLGSTRQRLEVLHGPEGGLELSSSGGFRAGIRLPLRGGRS